MRAHLGAILDYTAVVAFGIGVWWYTITGDATILQIARDHPPTH